jgi:hypothetical protein
MTAVETLGSPTNDGAATIDTTAPYIATVTIEGTAPILFHRWSNEAVAEKAAAAKGSKAKKSDDVESYVYRCDDEAGSIGIPGLYLVGSMVDPRNGAAKYRQDPRSPRKSALDLFRAGVVALTDITPILVKRDGVYQPTADWDYLDARRVTVQRSAITRERPAFRAGWRAQFDISVLTPEYIPTEMLLDVLTQAGRLVGIADFRPTFGRFAIVGFEVSS